MVNDPLSYQSFEIIPAKLRNNFWLVSADMGYGHQRAIYPLAGLARGGKILIANNAPGASSKEIKVMAPHRSSTTGIIYLASGTISAKRLLSYGVPERNIIVTGFPLPVELLGDRSLTVLKNNLVRRLVNLDPSGTFSDLYRHRIKAYLGNWDGREKNQYPLTITYAVGGAGAQPWVYLKARKFGTFNILEFLEKGTFTVNNDPLKR